MDIQKIFPISLIGGGTPIKEGEAFYKSVYGEPRNNSFDVRRNYDLERKFNEFEDSDDRVLEFVSGNNESLFGIAFQGDDLTAKDLIGTEINRYSIVLTKPITGDTEKRLNDYFESRRPKDLQIELSVVDMTDEEWEEALSR